MTRTDVKALVALIAGVAGLLSGCGATRTGAEPIAQTVQIEGTSYTVEELTASTWTALAPRSLPNGPQKTAALVKAIEKASRCKVTDSSYGARSAALTAQVDCGGKLKN